MFPGISDAELETRRQVLLDHIRSRNLNGLVLFDSSHIRYATGFTFLSTERPVIFAMGTTGDLALLVPAFERSHASLKSGIERVETYAEYPGEMHPMIFLGEMLADLGIVGRIGADADGYPGILSYRGPALGEVTGAAITLVGDFVEEMMAIKSREEIAAIRESATWCHLGHRLLQRYSLPGITEGQASVRAESEATLAMLDALGAVLESRLGSSDGVKAGYRGQIGRYSAFAHAVTGNHTFRRGDVLVSETGAPVAGYSAELERTMVVGAATDEQKRLFEHMAAAQAVALRAIRPGRTCSDVDRDVLTYFEENHLTQYWGQHTGHAIGLRDHEAPFLDVGDHTEIKPGMVFTVEPGLYVDGVGGFRHSDTVAVTKDGIDVLTYYPRDLESLTIPG
jgi:Xaa-Pro aminopeptidase